MRIWCIFSFLSFIDTLFLYIRSCDHLYTYIVLILFICWCMFLSPLHVLFLFYLYALASYHLNAIYYFCFTQRCLDEFCLKCFKNTGCQILLAINSLLAKFFKSLCRDRFYCINKWVWVEWFMTSLICSFVYCGFLTDCQRGRLLGHMWIMLETYVNILCNWLILWQNALYLYLGRFRMSLNISRNLVLRSSNEAFKSV